MKQLFRAVRGKVDGRDVLAVLGCGLLLWGAEQFHVGAGAALVGAWVLFIVTTGRG